MRQNQSLTGNFDWPLFTAVLVLMTLGIATVYSVAYDPEHPSIFSFSEKYGKQIIWLLISLFLGTMVFLIDSDIYKKFSIPIYGITIVLLMITLFMPPIHGARAWLGIGSLGVQPAEFAKIGTALLLSHFLGGLNPRHQTAETVLIAIGIIGLPMGLILLQPDAGTFLVFTGFLFIMYREGVTFDPIILNLINALPGVRFKQTWVGTHFIPILFVVIFLSVITLILSNEKMVFDSGLEFSGYWRIPLGLLIIWIVIYGIMRWMFAPRFRKKALITVILGFTLCTTITGVVYLTFEKLARHQKERIELLLGIYTPDENSTARVEDGADYNRNRAMAAVGSGGFFGKGYRNASVSSVQSNHVPESETDFIFCPFAEEWGFAGSALLIATYMFMMFRIVQIAERQRSPFNRVYAYCVAIILFYHFAINVGMNIGFAPVIGIPLPFFSYGGSSTMSFAVMMCILLKLDSQRKDVLN